MIGVTIMIAILTRTALTVMLLFMVYQEAGPWTSLTIGLMHVSIEFGVYSYRGEQR
jgi:hypothetical protein